MENMSRSAGSVEVTASRYRPRSDQPLFGQKQVLAGDPGTLQWSSCAKAEIEARAARARFFKASLFSDPAWDILLDLFAADQEGRRISISAVGLTAGIPLTTALRWINALEREDLVERAGDPTDARRTFLRLSDKGRGAMSLYFQNRFRTAAPRP
jgi:DNA-binding MarR family transcriptional regulator